MADEEKKTLEEATGIPPSGDSITYSSLPPEPDLTKERDDVCIPLAKVAIALIGSYPDIAMGAVGRENALKAYDNLAKAILGIMLEANVPISYVNYIKQLALQPYDFAFNLVIESMNANLDKLARKTFGSDIADMKLGELNRRLLDR